MKGAFLIAENDTLFATVRELLTRIGAAASDDYGGIVQYTDPEGRLLTAEADPGPEFAYREGPFVAAATGDRLPDMRTVTAIDVTCRWEDVFVRVCADIAAAAQYPVWVLDDDGVIWPADRVDPRRVRL